MLFIASMAFGLNFIGVQNADDLLAVVLALVGINIFVISLLCLWLGAYVNTFRRRGFLVYGHAGVYFAGGYGMFALGANALLGNSCSFLMQEGAGRQSLISRMGALLAESQWCPLFGIAMIALGCFVAFPSYKLLTNVAFGGLR